MTTPTPRDHATHPGTVGPGGPAAQAPRPDARTVARAVGLRAVLPMLGLLVVDLVIGFVITGPLGGLKAEGAVNRVLQEHRSAGLDAVTRFLSFLAGTPANLTLVAVSIIATWIVSRRWWVALVPALALSVEALVHFVTTMVVNRQRPPVAQLDIAQPTMSYPSGHIGATLAQLLVLVMFAGLLRNRVLRVLPVVFVVLFIAAVFFSRLYLGMHHLSDCVVGVGNGVASALIAWRYLPDHDGGIAWRRPRTALTDGR